MYLLFWAMPLLCAIGLITGALRATRSMSSVGLVVVVLTVLVAFDGHASLAHGDYCDTGFDCPDLEDALFLGTLAVAALLLPYFVTRGVRDGAERRSGRAKSGNGEAADESGNGEAADESGNGEAPEA